MTIKLGGYTFDADALRNADWQDSEDIDSGTYRLDDYGERVIAEYRDEYHVNLRSIYANGVRAKNADGQDVTVSVELCRSDCEDTEVSVDFYPVDGIKIDGEDSNMGELEDVIGVEVSDVFELDYKNLAQEFMADHPGYVYVVDHERGFSNEWTVYACANEAEVEAIKIGRDRVCQYDDKIIAAYIADALMSPEVYRREHLATKINKLCYAKDHYWEA